MKAYLKTNKGDLRDAEAICEAVQRPTMHFVPVKTVEQQAILALRRSRELLISQRTQLGNSIRSHLAEFGVYLRLGSWTLSRRVAELQQAATGRVPDRVRGLIELLLAKWKQTHELVLQLDRDIEREHRASEPSNRLGKL